MKKTATKKKAGDLSIDKKVEQVLSHIQGVQRNCYRLGMRLINDGEKELGRMLIANGQVHDNSKFKGIEFEHLFGGDALLTEVIKHHVSTNPHHPEYWGSIHAMPEVYVAEMVCDCLTRGSEFGTDVHEFFSEVATKKYGFNMTQPVGKTITKYLNLILSTPFTS